MKTVFYCKKVVKNRLAFYMRSDRGSVYLFTESYYGSLYSHFERGITIDTMKTYDESTKIGMVSNKMKNYIMDDVNLKKIYKMRLERSAPKEKKRLFKRNDYRIKVFCIPVVES